MVNNIKEGSIYGEVNDLSVYDWSFFQFYIVFINKSERVRDYFPTCIYGIE